LAKKESYRHKNADKISAEHKEQTKFVVINDAVKAEFETGKVLLIDKPLHWTSFDIVRKIRGTLRIKKVGHAGTLDPLATGLLIICTGKFTKQINEYMAQVKEYTGSFTLGAVTPTYDLESQPEQHKPFTQLTTDEIIQATKNFIGEIEQFPPIYSAIKVDGEALYKLARRGEDVELKARKITIQEFVLTKIELPIIEFKIVCTTGTYIRSIANDFGAALNCGAYLSRLRRTKIGDFDVTNGVTVHQFMEDLETMNIAKTDN
jgi:tRNA pseudouridine55 synthase